MIGQMILYKPKETIKGSSIKFIYNKRKGIIRRTKIFSDYYMLYFEFTYYGFPSLYYDFFIYETEIIFALSISRQYLNEDIGIIISSFLVY
uniref:Uncharacterized protein n=1 Tax=viral metagenome TaxID=1070528 RepID=A0A6C0ESJ6_9ZZZZ